MLTAFSIVLLLAAFYYASLIGFFAVGFRRVRRCPSSRLQTPAGTTTPLPFVSIIIAARDEEQHLEACLHSVLANDYPPDAFEIIVVDDFSQDGTAALVQRFQRQPHAIPTHVVTPPSQGFANVCLVKMEDHAKAASGHKRHALHQGIQRAQGTLILTTDADCTTGPHWIRTMVSSFTPETGFVAGPVRYRPGKTLFGQFQALEFLAFIATGAGGIGMGRPNMCNSANVAYRRKVYDHYGALGDDQVVHPGDDEVMAQRLASDSAWEVRFCAHIEAMVETDPLLNVNAFWKQRRRWASTGPKYPQTGLVAAIMCVYGFYVLLFAGLIAALFTPLVWPSVAVALLLKIASETTLLYPACVHFEQRRLFRYFLPEQLVQIPYGVFLGAAAAMGPTTWKGRKLQ